MGMGLFSRFNTNSSRQLFHSSGVVGDADGQTLGTTSAESFEQRQQVEHSRRFVGGYRDAGVLHNYRKEAHDDITSQKDDAKDKKPHHEDRLTSRVRNVPSSRIDIVKSSRITKASDTRSSTPAGKPNSIISRPSFQEPSARRYNPYQ